MVIDKLKDWLGRYAKYFAFVIFPNGTSTNTNVTPVPTLTYMQQYFTPFNNASWDFGIMTPIGVSVIGDFFAQPLGNQIVEGFVLVNILGIIWVRQEDAAIPLFLMWVLSAVMFGMNVIPQEWQWFIGAIEGVILFGIVYTLYRGRRNS
jgi:hypothetical protein